MIEAYLTAEQVAQCLQVDVTTVYRWADEDPSMPCVRIGRTIRFPSTRLQRWLDAREQGRARPRRTPQMIDQLSVAPNPASAQGAA